MTAAAEKALGSVASHRREIAGEGFHVAFAKLGVAVQRDQDAHGRITINGADLGRHVGSKHSSIREIN